MADRFKHASYLAVTSFLQRHPDTGAVDLPCHVPTEKLYFSRSRTSTIKWDTRGQLLQLDGTRDSACHHLVDTFDAMARVGQSGGEVSVVGQ